ncbi:hypothetical protein BJ875DRAFT_129439 [Amylocarpus encephaloides]|uniref:Uncharacterized protein n=1 Tax=Amylocarpus encephaloides TaxID=45428 RepID=A0A9P7YC16_9HELO|nr:hypothetical protein BJ875DRAFT_129439 [Amylocarpus encephaloides]
MARASRSSMKEGSGSLMSLSYVPKKRMIDPKTIPSGRPFLTNILPPEIRQKILKLILLAITGEDLCGNVRKTTEIHTWMAFKQPLICLGDLNGPPYCKARTKTKPVGLRLITRIMSVCRLFNEDLSRMLYTRTSLYLISRWHAEVLIGATARLNQKARIRMYLKKVQHLHVVVHLDNSFSALNQLTEYFPGMKSLTCQLSSCQGDCKYSVNHHVETLMNLATFWHSRGVTVHIFCNQDKYNSWAGYRNYPDPKKGKSHINEVLTIMGRKQFELTGINSVERTFALTTE